LDGRTEPTQKPTPEEIQQYAQQLYEEGVDENEIRKIRKTDIFFIE